ncbi:sterol desaturase family protein [Hyphococcus lacteus]|uniref:Sterol desaturase family protein n=1 Tax=Hyphococcus lacteus TaxID=3143536 RepID=A0ABV3Z739_9PROT
MEFPDIIALAVPVFLILVITEIVAVRIMKRGRYEARDSAASLLMGFGSELAPLLGGGAIVVAAFAGAYELRFFDIPNTLWAVALCFVIDDLRYYWWHRISHERRWFWASHVVHHSSQHYNLTTALRQTWTGQILTQILFRAPLVLIGFHPAMVVFVGALNLLYQFWIHTEIIGRLGPIEWVFNTPSHHRVHHATNPKYLDANYAGTLIVWDRLFGTFVREDESEKPRYGIIKNLGTFNPIIISFHEWVGILKDVRSAKSFRDVLGYTFGPPGWSPDGSRQTSVMIKERWQRINGPDRKEADARKLAQQPAE